MEDWARLDADNAKKYHQQLEQSKKGSAAEFDFYSAAQQARSSIEADNLLPKRGEYGELKYRHDQGIMAACLAREDVALIATLQLSILKRLDRNRNYMAAAIVLLVYIAVKLG